MPHQITARPGSGEHEAYYQRYIDAVPPGDLIAILETQIHELTAMLSPRGEAVGAHRYAPDKWSVRQVVGHVIDTERVFSYRAAHMAHADPAPLPGFDQDVWVAAGAYDARSVESLLAEFAAVRRASIAMATALSEDALERRGVASDFIFSVRALLCILAGHVEWHLGGLRDAYGLGRAG